ncbi:MAG: iron chelate uptake ABC transporter family permease subunit [Helicobacteraceae bacterium]|nr:iron chelate uptake ABC transporter family permease subunit [Helicobacteraceae bacterium]
MNKLLTISILLILTISAPFVGILSLELSQLLVSGSFDQNIFFELRLPRLVLAFFAGGLLAISGWLFQTLFRNPLLTPFTLGVSTGAVLGVAIVIVFGGSALYMSSLYLSLGGFIGAMSSTSLLIYFSKYLKSASSILLLGVALSFFFNASLVILFYMSSAMQTQAIVYFTMGSLATIGFFEPLLVTLASLLLLGFLYIRRFELSLLSVSEDSAKLKGVDVSYLTKELLVIASISIGILISITGPIGFIGLVVPHIVRVLYKKNSTSLLLPNFFIGAMFLSSCDLISRIGIAQSDIPIGIITALVGAPFFVYLILKR